MSKIYKLFVESAMIMGIVGISSVSYAAEGGINPHMMWRVIDFVIFCGLLFYFLRKPMYEFFKSRKEGIVKELEEAEKLKEEAEKLLKESREKLELLEKEIKNITDTFETMADNEYKRILADAERIVSKIRESIEEEKKSLLLRARKRLLYRISNEVIDNLKKRFGKLSFKEHEKINEKFIRSLG